jgi:hypothetical protein
MNTIPVRIVLVFALFSLAGFFAAGATTGTVVAVLIGALGLIGAAASLAIVIDATTPRTP